LSIYMPDNRLSPILPHFGVEDRVLSYPPAALVHVRSDSALSNFSIPRKPLNSHKSMSGRLETASAHTTPESVGSEFVSHPLRPRPSLPESPSTQELMAALQEALPLSPPPARLRANTAPVIYRNSVQAERIKSVMQEKHELEKRLKDIDSIIEERRSVYLSSHSGSIYSESEEPMPDLKTSQLERMPLPTRPKTAPHTVHIPVRAKSFTEASAAFDNRVRTPPPPPLPLVLQTRPPLRKKKSFSRVSSWLFPSEHARNISMDSVTNMPKPVTSREGFYQCIDTKATRMSIRSVSTVSTLESEIDEPTAPTTLTPGSSPGAATKRGNELTRATTFGGMEGRNKDFELGYRVSSVGVAF